MRIDTIIIMPGEGDSAPSWLRAADGAIVQRGRSLDWGGARSPGDRTLVVLPPQATTLHWIACTDMTPRQGAAAARIMALEASIGDAASLHAVAMPAVLAEEAHLVAVIGRDEMERLVAWCAEHGLDDAPIVPAAALLPAPDEGFVHGRIGDHEVVRGVDTAFDAADPHAGLIAGDAPIQTVPDLAVEVAMFAALGSPPLDLRQGDYAPRRRSAFDAARVKRMAFMVAALALVSLLVPLVTLVKLNWTASRLDAQTVEMVKAVDPAVTDAQDAVARITSRLTARGGNGGFNGAVASLMLSMQANAAVALTNLSQDADGTLRVQFAATKAEEINDVLIALQEAGWRISANAVQQRGARLVADIQMVRS